VRGFSRNDAPQHDPAQFTGIVDFDGKLIGLSFSQCQIAALRTIIMVVRSFPDDHSSADFRCMPGSSAKLLRNRG
jgi:hypothetical protein